jgi:hypothetical protein
MYHAANPCLDEVISDMSTSFSVETDLSELVQGSTSPSRCYVRLWDILEAMGSLDANFSDNITLSCELPAPDVETIFNSPEFALLVFKKLRMDSGIGIFKLDPSFFIKYPELCDPNEENIANGISIAPANQTRIPGPEALDARMSSTYKHLALWSFDMLFKIPPSTLS